MRKGLKSSHKTKVANEVAKAKKKKFVTDASWPIDVKGHKLKKYEGLSLAMKEFLSSNVDFWTIRSKYLELNCHRVPLKGECNLGFEMCSSDIVAAEKYVNSGKSVYDALRLYIESVSNDAPANLSRKKLIKSGTARDQITALGVMIKEAPLTRLEEMEALIKLIMVGHRDSRIYAANVCSEIFEQLIGPNSLTFSIKSDLRHFKKTKAGTWIRATEIMVLLIYFEDRLKSIFWVFVQALIAGISDGVKAFSHACLAIAMQIMSKTNEQLSFFVDLACKELSNQDKKMRSIARAGLHRYVEKEGEEGLNLVLKRTMEECLKAIADDKTERTRSMLGIIMNFCYSKRTDTHHRKCFDFFGRTMQLTEKMSLDKQREWLNRVHFVILTAVYRMIKERNVDRFLDVTAVTNLIKTMKGKRNIFQIKKTPANRCAFVNFLQEVYCNFDLGHGKGAFVDWSLSMAIGKPNSLLSKNIESFNKTMERAFTKDKSDQKVNEAFLTLFNSALLAGTKPLENSIDMYKKIRKYRNIEKGVLAKRLCFMTSQKSNPLAQLSWSQSLILTHINSKVRNHTTRDL